MDKLTEIVAILTGDFTNASQYEALTLEAQKTFPYAVHKNHWLNDKIIGLSTDFIGELIHEESYYTLRGKEKFKTDIFLFTYTETGQVQLIAIDAPKAATNCPFNQLTTISFDELSKSEKFTPLVYTYQNGQFTGKSQSMFTKKTRFILEQTLSPDELVIKEEMYNGDKQIFGFDTPIIYKKEAV